MGYTGRHKGWNSSEVGNGLTDGSPSVASAARSRHLASAFIPLAGPRAASRHGLRGGPDWSARIQSSGRRDKWRLPAPPGLAAALLTTGRAQGDWRSLSRGAGAEVVRMHNGVSHSQQEDEAVPCAETRTVVSSEAG